MQVPCKKCLHGCRLHFPDWLLPLRFLFSTHFYLLVLVAQRLERLMASVLHDRYSHARNFMGLLSNTAILLSTGNKYLFLFQCHLFHGIHPPQSQQLRKGPSSIQRAAIQHSQVGVDFSIIPWPTSQTDAKFPRDESFFVFHGSRAVANCSILRRIGRMILPQTAREILFLELFLLSF